MVDTSSLSGISSASGFSTTDSSDSSNASDDTNASSYSHDTTTTGTNSRDNISAHDDIEAFSQEPSTTERILNTPSLLDTYANQEVAKNDSVFDSIDALPSGTGAAGHALSTRGYGIQVDNPLLTKTYESTVSAWTGNGGFTAPAAERLQNAGIEIRVDNSPATGSITKPAAAAQGIPQGEAATINGAATENAIVDRYRAQGLEVDMQAKFDSNFNPIERAANQPGDRAVDVVVNRPHPSDPRLNEVEHIESKAFRVNNSDNHIKPNQFSHDVGMLENNRTLRTAGIALERTGRVLRPVGLTIDAISVGKAIYNDGGIGVETGRTVTGIAGGAGGGWAGATSGAAIGATIGSAVPIVGTAVGAVIGGIVGGLGGAAIGEHLATGVFDTIKGWFD